MVVSRKGAGRRSEKRVEKAADGHYLLIDGRRWRATNPALPEKERQRLVRLLMKARRDVGQALKEDDVDALRRARRRVNKYKTALGERGPKWWESEEQGKKQER